MIRYAYNKYMFMKCCIMHVGTTNTDYRLHSHITYYISYCMYVHIPSTIIMYYSITSTPPRTKSTTKRTSHIIRSSSFQSSTSSLLFSSLPLIPHVYSSQVCRFHFTKTLLPVIIPDHPRSSQITSPSPRNRTTV